jgi:hypothetical protein
MFARSNIYFRLYLLLIIITNSCISLSLRWTSAPIYLTSVLGVLRTQETFYIVIVGLLESDSFDLLLPEFDKPWVIHLRETWCCSINLCTWRPNTIYKNIRVCRHQSPFGGETGDALRRVFGGWGCVVNMGTVGERGIRGFPHRIRSLTHYISGMCKIAIRGTGRRSSDIHFIWGVRYAPNFGQSVSM